MKTQTVDPKELNELFKLCKKFVKKLESIGKVEGLEKRTKNLIGKIDKVQEKGPLKYEKKSTKSNGDRFDLEEFDVLSVEKNLKPKTLIRKAKTPNSAQQFCRKTRRKPKFYQKPKDDDSCTVKKRKKLDITCNSKFEHQFKYYGQLFREYIKVRRKLSKSKQSSPNFKYRKK